MYKAGRGIPCRCDSFGECVYCRERRLTDELATLKADFSKAQDYIHELLTYADRANTEIVKLKTFTASMYECRYEPDKLLVMLERRKAQGE